MRKNTDLSWINHETFCLTLWCFSKIIALYIQYICDTRRRSSSLKFMFTSTAGWPTANRQRRRRHERVCVCPARACGQVWQTTKALCRKCAQYEWSSDDNVQRSAANDYIIIFVVVVDVVTFSRFSGGRIYFNSFY